MDTAETKERIFNLFVYVDGDTITELGAVVHEVDGTDLEKCAFLKSAVDSDHKIAHRLPLVTPVARHEFETMIRLKTQHELFEDVFRRFGHDILRCITPIVDGKPTFRGDGGDADLAEGPGVKVDYLQKYVQDGKFDPHQLINDDFFIPIQLLINARHYISAAKLLMSAIDSVAFVETGDVGTPFVRWLERYVDLTVVGVTARELLEFRHGLLHMSNLASRAVLRGEVSRLILYVGDARDPAMVDTKEEKYFSFIHLYEAISAGLGRWIATYVGNHPRFLEFVERYDLTVSDQRLAYSEAKEKK
jgi:hypothetical protein